MSKVLEHFKDALERVHCVDLLRVHLLFQKWKVDEDVQWTRKVLVQDQRYICSTYAVTSFR